MQYDRGKILKGRRILEEAAEEGDADALCFLARTYMGPYYVWRYSGLSEDDKLAKNLLRDSIRMGSACGVLTAMRCGVLTPRIKGSMPFASLKEAWDIVYKKAEAGHPFCQYIIGNVYFWWDIFEIEETDPMGKYGSTDNAEVEMARLAEPWLERAVEGGLGIAVANLYNLYNGEHGYPKDEAKRLEIEQRGAEAGHPLWMYNYGWDLDDAGQYEEARGYLLRAAEMGQSDAWNPLAYQYYQGRGVPKDHTRALRYYEKGAHEGRTSDQFMTAYLYFRGEGVPKDAGKVFYWARRAVSEGDEKRAYVLLGHCLLFGEGVKQDEKAGLDLLFAAREHDEEAYAENEQHLLYQEDRGLLYSDLGDAYADGHGVEQDYEQAIRFYDEVAEWDDYAKIQRARFKKSFFSRKWTRR